MAYTDYLDQLIKAAQTGTGTNIRPDETINNMYSQRTAAQEAALNSAYQQNLANINAQIGQVPAQYNPLKNQASVSAEASRRAIQENIANAGYSKDGGESLTQQQTRENNLRSNLTSIGLAQQQALDQYGLQKTNLGTQYTGDVASMQATNESERLQALLNQQQTDTSNYLNMRQSELQTYLSLLDAGKITNAQFKEKTGIDVQDIKRSTGEPKVEGDKELYDFLISQGTDQSTASFISGYKPTEGRTTTGYAGSGTWNIGNESTSYDAYRQHMIDTGQLKYG
jgi:hypothetical protein